MGTVTNLQTVRGDVVAPGNGQSASGSRAGEDNSKHVVGGILLLAGLAIAAGLVNVKLSAGTGRG
jgi:hypothetical protein